MLFPAPPKTIGFALLRHLPGLAALLISTALFAQPVPTTINYQGLLTDNTPARTPVNATVPMRFAIYDAATDGTMLWSEPASGGTSVPVSNGIFNVALGSNGVPIVPAVFTGATSARYLEITINPDSSPEILSPRQLVTATGYANLAQSANSADSLRSATGQVNVSAATAPAPGQVLTATGATSATWQTPAAAPMQSGLQFRFTQPNGNGFESSASTWIRAGTFVYRGTSAEKIPTSFIALVYTTNASSHARVRIWDVTNNAIIAMGPPSNLGFNYLPAIADLGMISNLPMGPSVFEIQILSTDATGQTGIAGRQAVGIHSLQMY